MRLRVRRANAITVRLRREHKRPTNCDRTYICSCERDYPLTVQKDPETPPLEVSLSPLCDLTGMKDAIYIVVD